MARFAPFRRAAGAARLALLASFLLLVAGCSDRLEPDPVVSPELATSTTAPTVVITPALDSLAVGGTAQLKATLKDANGTWTGSYITWSSSDVTVLKVVTTGTGTSGGAIGNLTALKTGSATITAKTQSGSTGSRTIRVVPVAAGSTTPAPTGPAPTGVAIYPGESIQNKVNSYPAGTQFVLKAGTHRQQTVSPKSGDRFIGETGAIMNGGNIAAYAFFSNGSNVYIKGIVVEAYKPPVGYAAIRGDGAPGWVVESCEVRYNATGGIRTGRRMQLLNNNVHHNGQMGISGSGDSMLVQGNEIAYNNYQKAYSFSHEAGGTKFVRTRDLVVRGNYVHDNYGSGLHTDIDNVNTLYENNRSENNAQIGIFHEIGYKAIIRNNTTRGNGYAGGWLAGAGIFVNTSQDVEIYGNTVSGNRNGITAVESKRGAGAYGTYILRNLYVHDNKVTMASGVTGISPEGTTETIIFSSGRSNRFQHNTYYLGANANYYSWNLAQRNETQWKAYGEDVTGVFIR